MTISVQLELKNNPFYVEYIRNNSYWYKILTRNPNSILDLKKEIKDFQHKQKINKFTSTLEYIEMLQAVMSSLK
ncbi:MAG TPA: YlbE-like family protein [Bacilli bacterium]|nr:YlbE-like family protein [Bacilli bacterium]